MDSVLFRYFYRDGSNFKRWSAVVFANPDQIGLRSLKRALASAFGPDNSFIADQVRIPEVFLYDNFNPNADDHCYHEFSAVESTNESANDPLQRSIRDFAAEVRRESRRGWLPFDPFDRGLREAS